MQLEEAFRSLQEIRQRLNVIDHKRPFRAVSLGFSGCLALVVPCFFLPELISLPDFLLIWFLVATASFLLVGMELLTRSVASDSKSNTRWAGDLLKKLVPTFVVCMGLTWASVSNSALSTLLPGIWSLFYGFGLLSCGTLLPKVCKVAISYFLLGGMISIQSSTIASLPLSVQMALLFGFGQIVLYFCLFFGVKNDVKQG